MADVPLPNSSFETALADPPQDADPEAARHFSQIREKHLTVYVDADACPVKEEIYKVAERFGERVAVVANSFMQVPRVDWIERVVVSAGPDIADDWIAERAGSDDVVVTADLPLAGRCVAAGAAVLAPDGRAWTPANIGAALATRNLLTDLRSAGQDTRGPKPFSPKDRSAFLSALDLALTRLARARKA